MKILLPLIALVVSGCASMSLPTDATAVAAATRFAGGDGYQPLDRTQVFGPRFIVARDVMGIPSIYGQLQFSPANGFLWYCQVLQPNVNAIFNSAYADDGTQLRLFRTSQNLATTLDSGSDAFWLSIPDSLLRRGRPTGVKAMIYGNSDQRQIAIPSWYVEGFLQKVSF